VVPDDPLDPELPLVPEVPDDPLEPVEPDDPEDPLEPEDPDDPLDPEEPDKFAANVVTIFERVEFLISIVNAVLLPVVFA
jgi:hypothetical protein